MFCHRFRVRRLLTLPYCSLISDCILQKNYRCGGTKAGIRGCFIGIVVGVIFAPFGGISIIICPFLGALIGELIAGQKFDIAIKSGIGSFVGFLLTSGIKIILVLMICYHFFKAVF